MICMTAMCGVLTLSSCSEEVMNMEGPSTDSGAGQSQLRVTTRGDGDTPFQSRLYVFNAADQCVQQLSPDANGQLVTTTLPAGTYDLYGIGSDDLSHFVWPSADDAIPTMAITVAEGQPMGDLMMGHETITLSDGDHETLDIQLTRKVTHVNSILIHEVPDEVEQVSVAVSPMYQSILLNGTLADPSGTYTVNLMDLGSGDRLGRNPRRDHPAQSGQTHHHDHVHQSHHQQILYLCRCPAHQTEYPPHAGRYVYGVARNSADGHDERSGLGVDTRRHSLRLR